jgi:hypothetical protein
MRSKRTVFVLALILLLISSAVFPVFAIEPAYEPSSQYRASKYYDNLRKLPQARGRASDVLAVALSQLGYHEGNSNADLGGGNLSGTRDFVEYNVLYGKLDNNQGNGVSYGYYWCASFVNWCLRQAGVSKEASAGAYVSCWKWREATINAGIYNGKADYAPKSGDIVFFNDGESYVASSHIGFVLYSDSSKVYTIEGNTSNGSEFSKDGNYVALKSYSLTSPYIVGYATPKYASETEEVDYSDKTLSAGQYISTADIEIYQNTEMSGKSKALNAFEVFSVKEISGEVFKIYYGSDGDEDEGYANIRGLAKQLNVDETVYKLRFLDTDGTPIFDDVYRLAESEIEIPNIRPKKEKCGFVGWVNLSEGSGQDAKIIHSGDKLAGQASDIVLQALWDTNLYTVSFFDEDGTLLHEEKGYYGDIIPQMHPAQSPEGYLFDSWSGDGIPTVITGNVSYVATYRVDKNYTPLGKDQEKGGCNSSAVAFIVLPCAIICAAVFIIRKKK